MSAERFKEEAKKNPEKFRECWFAINPLVASKDKKKFGLNPSVPSTVPGSTPGSLSEAQEFGTKGMKWGVHKGKGEGERRKNVRPDISTVRNRRNLTPVVKEWKKALNDIDSKETGTFRQRDMADDAVSLMGGIRDSTGLRDTKTFVAKLKGKVVGAMLLDQGRFDKEFVDPDDPPGVQRRMKEYVGALEVDYVVTHPDIIVGRDKVRGVGTSLMLQAAKVAAGKGVGICLSPLDRAVPFYKKLGLKYSRMIDDMWWDKETVKAFARSGGKR
jgi:hypothetical protein